MVVLVGDVLAESCCHRCRMLPGWHMRPEVVAAIDFDEQLLAPVVTGSVEDGSTLQ